MKIIKNFKLEKTIQIANLGNIYSHKISRKALHHFAASQIQR